MSILHSILACIGLLSLPASALVAAESLSLAKDGQPNAFIVLSSKPSAAAREGASILSDHLKQVCGGAFQVVGEDKLIDATVKDGRILTQAPGSVENFILVGEGRLTQFLGAT